MISLVKPQKLQCGDTIATISPCNGWAGDNDIKWKYELGKKRLQEIGLNVISAPNSLKGSEYLCKNPKARAEDFMWAFENKNVNAVITNVGGNDSIKVIPYIDEKCIKNNHKIFIGFSDALNLHILCYKCGLSTFYGDNLLYPIAEAQGWHEYSKYWFEKTLFCSEPVGKIPPAKEWTFERTDYVDQHYVRKYYTNPDYVLIQGQKNVHGALLGGHLGLMDLVGSKLELTCEDFESKILFLEDIQEFYTPDNLELFFDWLGKINALQKLSGIILGKVNENNNFNKHKERIIKIVAKKYGQSGLPILYGLNFGHSSPICVIPYGASAEIKINDASFSILESGVR